jgi:hypothetical protein
VAKKSLRVAVPTASSALVLAAALALTGCTSGGGTSASSSPSASSTVHITSYTQIKNINDAVVWAMTITPDTPNALNEIDHTGKLLKQYADADKKISSDDRTQIDAFIEKSQDAVAKKDLPTAGADLATAGQAALSALTGK